jgi:Fic family protein
MSHSFIDLNAILAGQPPRVGTILRAINTGHGREQLFAEQVPQLLDSLAEATRVASIQASTAIEGYDVPDQRAERLARGNGTRFRNRNEKEFAGYRDAADAISRDRDLRRLSASYPFVLSTQLHRYTTGEPGKVKGDENEIVSYENGAKRLIFRPVPPRLVESELRSLVIGYNDALDQDLADPVLLLGLFVLDFLAIHPVSDGNGRISRLLTVHELFRMGYSIARYTSIEQLIFESKHSYYDALEASQRGWHESEHDVWPWLTYFSTVLADAYSKFEAKVAGARSSYGSKAERARQWALAEAPPEFRFQEAVAALPGISPATIRVALNRLRREGRFEASRGASAAWKRLG